MKKLTTITLISLFTIAITANEHLVYKGDFNGIRCRGMANFKIIPSDSNYIAILTGDEEVLEYISVEEEGSLLTIDVVKKNVKLSKLFEKAIVKIYCVELEYIKLEGAAIMESIGPLFSENLFIELNGTCKCELNAECVTFESKIRGTSMLNITGKAKHSVISIEGIGSLQARYFESETMDISLEGIGSAVVNASYDLKGRVTGVGTIEYFGEPQEKDCIIDGVGSIRQLE